MSAPAGLSGNTASLVGFGPPLSILSHLTRHHVAVFRVGGVGGVGRVPAGVQLRLLWRQAAQVGTGAVAGGAAAAGVGGGDVAPEARGASPGSRPLPRSLPPTALEEIAEDREDRKADRVSEEERLATMRGGWPGEGPEKGDAS